MGKQNIKIIGLGETGRVILEKLIQRGFKPGQCILLSGIPQHLSKSPARTRILLEGKSFDERYCYHDDDPAWGNQMAFEKRQMIGMTCRDVDLAIVVADAYDNADTGAAASVAVSIRKEVSVIISILLKPLGHQILTGTNEIVKCSDMTVFISHNQIKQLSACTASILDVFSNARDMVSTIIFEIINGMNDGNICSIPLAAYKSTGIAYAGIGHGPSLQAAMDRALASPTLEYGALDRAVAVLVYFTVRQASDMNDRDEILAHLRNSFDRDIDFVMGTRIDPEHGYHATIIATGLL